MTKLARNLAVLEPSLAATWLPDAIDRRTERQRADIRLLLGFRKLGMGVRINALARLEWRVAAQALGQTQ